MWLWQTKKESLKFEKPLKRSITIYIIPYTSDWLISLTIYLVWPKIQHYQSFSYSNKYF